MYRLMLMSLVTVLVSACASTGSETVTSAKSKSSETPSSRYGEPMPVRDGTLANQKLIHDAMVGVVSKVATLGCSEPKDFKPYVLEMPKGEPGGRVWYERWVVSGCGKQYPIKIRFNEAGLGAADWTIE